MKINWNILLNPLYLASIILLFANDFLLKFSFPGFLTGKISDFAGVFAFTVFWMALFPLHVKKVAGISALWFIFWKSSFSQPLIDLFNENPFYHIQRVVDYWDLLALIMVPIALLYFNNYKINSHYLFLKRMGILLISLFVFGATSKGGRYGPYSSDNIYTHVYSSKKHITVNTSVSELENKFKQWSDHVSTNEQRNIWYINDVYVNNRLRINVTLQTSPRQRKTHVYVLEYHTCFTSQYDHDFSNTKSLDKLMEAKLKGKSELPQVP